MRQVGNKLSEPHARRFADYLVTLGIGAFPEHEDDGWVVWVRDEDHVTQSRDEYQKFLVTPDDSKYLDVHRAAEEIRREEEQQRLQARKNVIEMRGRWKQGQHGVRRNAPLVKAMIVLCIGVVLLTDFGSNKSSSIMRQLMFVDVARDVEAASEDPFFCVKRGELWRIFTPMFIHLDGGHIVFNMMAFYILGAQIEDRRGTVRFALLVLLTAAVSNITQAEFVHANFGGMSGVVYGLFGYSWMKWRFDPSLGIHLSRFVVVMMMGWLLICMTPLIPHVANHAHVAGLAVGVVVGFAPVLMGQANR